MSLVSGSRRGSSRRQQVAEPEVPNEEVQSISTRGNQSYLNYRSAIVILILIGGLYEAFSLRNMYHMHSHRNMEELSHVIELSSKATAKVAQLTAEQTALRKGNPSSQTSVTSNAINAAKLSPSPSPPSSSPPSPSPPVPFPSPPSPSPPPPPSPSPPPSPPPPSPLPPPLPPSPSIVSSPSPSVSSAAAGAAQISRSPGAQAAISHGCQELSKELVAAHAKSNTVMIATSDWRMYSQMGINWMQHLETLGVTYYLVAATDLQTVEYLGKHPRRPCFPWLEKGHQDAAKHEYKFDSEHYRAATWRKVVVVATIVRWGFNVLQSDVDVVWLRDPLPYFLSLREPEKELKSVPGIPDVAFSSDRISSSNQPGDGGLEIFCNPSTNYNTGLYFAYSTPGGKAFMNGWADMRITRSHVNDQWGMYEFMRASGQMSMFRRRTCTMRSNVTIHFGELPVSRLMNGYTYFIPKLHVAKQVEPLGIHFTWLPLSREGKLHRIRDGMLFLDPPEYYYSKDSRLMSVDIMYEPTPLGYSNWTDTELMIQKHVQLMDGQLKQVYRAMALAVLLNRTLVMPKLRCYCYKNWFMSEQCRIPGDKVTEFPIDCYLDQIFRPKILYSNIPIQSSSGTHQFRFREYSLLENPRFPAAVLKERTIVQAADVGGGCRDCVVAASKEEAEKLGVAQLLRMSFNPMQKDLLRGLAARTVNMPLLHFSNIKDAFGGFEDSTLKTSFEKFLDAVTTNWCCRDEPFVKQGMAKKIKMVVHM